MIAMRRKVHKTISNIGKRTSHAYFTVSTLVFAQTTK